MIELMVRLTPPALGVAMSPLPVVAVLVILLSKKAFPGSMALAVSWVFGVIAALGISIAFADTIRPPKVGVDAGAEGIFALLLGIGLLVMAGLSRRGRRRAPHGDEPPAWVNSVDNLGPWAAGFVAFTNATTSPKNLALAISAGKTIVNSNLSASELSVPVAYYVILASLSIVVPVVIYIVRRQSAVVTLKRWRDIVTRHAAAVMEIILFGLGIAMSVRGLYNLLT